MSEARAGTFRRNQQVAAEETARLRAEVNAARQAVWESFMGESPVPEGYSLTHLVTLALPYLDYGLECYGLPAEMKGTP
jgi:hypothetical protein